MSYEDSIIERIHRDFADQMVETGRPMERYILTPDEMNLLITEMRDDRRIPRKAIHPDDELVIYVGGSRITIIKGPP